MPIYEMNQSDILGGNISPIKQPDPQYGDTNEVGVLDVLNPLSDKGTRLRHAAFQLENSVGSLIAMMPFEQFDAQEGYNPYEDKRVLIGYEDYSHSFLESKSPEETSAIKQRIDKQRNNKQFVYESGFAGTVASIGMGVIEPINWATSFVPIGTLARGGSILATTGKFAASNAIGGMATELALSSTQETRTLEESVLNVTFDAMFGGILGSAAQLVKNRGQIVGKFKNDVLGEQQTAQQNIPNNIPENSSVGAMEVPTTTLEQEAMKGPSFINKTTSASPAGRLAQSPSKVARQYNQQLAENNFTFLKNEEGIASFAAVETKVRNYDALIYKVIEGSNQNYQKYKQNIKNSNEKPLSFSDFKLESGKSARRGDNHAIPEISENAKLNRNILNLFWDKGVELGIFKKGMETRTSESHLPRIYKSDKILSDRTRFRTIIADHLDGKNKRAVSKAESSLTKAEIGIEQARTSAPQAEKLNVEIKEAERWSGKESLLIEEIEKYNKLLAEKELATSELNKLKNLDKQNKTQAKKQTQLERKLSRIDEAETKLPTLQRSKEILSNPKKFRNEHRQLTRKANSLTRYDNRRHAALRRMEPLSREEVETAADDIINNIIGAPGGIVPRELIPDNITKHSGFTKSRTLDIPDELIEEFLESDINYVMENYIRQMAPEIELTKQFGRIDMDEQVKAITGDYNKLIAKAKTAKERSKLEARREADIEDIRAMRDRLLGTYKAPANPNSFFIRAGRIARHLNFLRLLGGMTISSLPDMARPIMQHGLRSALKPLGKMMTDISAMKIAKADLREMGIGLEYALSSRSKVIADLNDPYARRSFLERGLEWSSQKFGNFTLMNQYTDFMKMWSGVVTQSKILRASISLSQGKSLGKKEITKLAKVGIDKSMLERIAQQYSKHGEDLDGLFTGHSHLWDDRVVREAFQAAVLKDVRTTVTTPGIGDTPLFMSSEVGKIVMQFKTFFFAAHNRSLVSGIQSGDASFYYGALLQISLGSLVYVLKSMLAGRDINTEPANLVKEGLDWSGMMGWLGEPNNLIENLSGGTYGMSALFGGPPASRYQSRNSIGALFGPTFDMGGDIKNITAGVLNGEFDDSEARSVRKLMPFQNLFYLSPLLNQVEEQLK